MAMLNNQMVYITMIPIIFPLFQWAAPYSASHRCWPTSASVGSSAGTAQEFSTRQKGLVENL